jgi:hypothetical protein
MAAAHSLRSGFGPVVIDAGPGGPGLDFQRFSKSCPAFTAELALRRRANHFGPINTNTVELKRECWSLLLGIEDAIDLLGGCVAVV